MTDFPMFVPRRDSVVKLRGRVGALIHALVAALARMVEGRRARRAMRLPLKHMSDAQLHDIGLERTQVRPSWYDDGG